MSSKTIIITGGASGLGLGMARHFLSQSESNTVAILDINAREGSKLIHSLREQFPRSNSGKLFFKQCDISNWDSVAQAFSDVYGECGRMDLVMANAGISQESRLIVPEEEEEGPTKPELRTLEVNLIGTIYTVKLAIHYLRRNGVGGRKGTAEGDSSLSRGWNGAIICTSSNAGIYAFPVAPIYSATKFGVVGLVRSLAPSLERERIRINALAPNTLETNIAPSKDLWKEMKLTPMETLMKGVDMLIGDEKLTGQVVEVSGDNATLVPDREYVDDNTRYNMEKFWSLGYA